MLSKPYVIRFPEGWTVWKLYGEKFYEEFGTWREAYDYALKQTDWGSNERL